MKQVAAKNLALGDGYFWKHPECKNYKGIWVSVNCDWLKKKSQIFSEIPTRLAVNRQAGAPNCYPNAKTLYSLTTRVDPVFTEYAQKNKKDIISELTLLDLALWYLDDGCLIHRKEKSGGYRFTLCVGDVIGCEEILLDRVSFLTKIPKVGRIYKNNSKASARNKTYYMTNAVGFIVAAEAMKFCPHSLARKLPG